MRAGPRAAPIRTETVLFPRRLGVEPEQPDQGDGDLVEGPCEGVRGRSRGGEEPAHRQGGFSGLSHTRMCWEAGQQPLAGRRSREGRERGGDKEKTGQRGGATGNTETEREGREGGERGQRGRGGGGGRDGGTDSGREEGEKRGGGVGKEIRAE